MNESVVLEFRGSTARGPTRLVRVLAKEGQVSFNLKQKYIIMYLCCHMMIYQNIKHLLFLLVYEKISRKLMIKENSPSLRKPV